MHIKFVAPVVLLASLAVGQTTSAPNAAPTTPQSSQPSATAQAASTNARPEDVSTVKGIINALYDVISGPAGDRDWQRFHSLFIPDARMIVTGKRPDGTNVQRVLKPSEYQERSGAMFKKEGFFESTIGNRVERYGNIAHVFSTYEARHEKGGKPFARGINSIQLVHDGNRWWVATILWFAETPDQPLPQQYIGRDDLSDAKLGGK